MVDATGLVSHEPTEAIVLESADSEEEGVWDWRCR